MVMKKILTVSLAVLMLLSCVSCGDASQGDTETGSNQSTTAANTEVVTEDPNYVCDLPKDLKYGGETVTVILNGSPGKVDEFISEEIGGGVVSDAVFERNTTVEEMLDIKLDFYPVDNVIQSVDQDIQSGTSEYEIVVNVTFAACIPAIEGKYLNLSALDNIDTSKHYWTQGYNDMSTFTDEGIQYLASGPMAISMFRLAFLTLYNKQLFEERNIADLYEVVMNGDWTLDYQYSIAKDLYHDKDGDGKASNGDFYGFVSGDTVSVDPYMVTSDIHMITKDPETGDLVYDQTTVARLSDLCDKVQLLYNNESSRIYKGMEDIVASDSVINHFTSENTLMATTLFYKMETSYDRLGELSYGVAPLPKYDTVQDDYHSYVQAEVSSFGISAGIGDKKRQEKCAAALEAIAYHSYRMVRPAYYETVLSARYMQDPESDEMMDLIFRTLDFDFASCWSDIFGAYNIRNGLRPVLSGKNNTVSSTTRSWQRSIERMLITYNEQIRENAQN